MFVIALLFVVALLGLFVTIGFIIAGAANFAKDGKRVARMIQPSTNTLIELANTGKGIGIKGKIRYDGYVKQGKRIYESVKETSDEIGAAVKSIDIEPAKDILTQASRMIKIAQAVSEQFEKSKTS